MGMAVAGWELSKGFELFWDQVLVFIIIIIILIVLLCVCCLSFLGLVIFGAGLLLFFLLLVVCFVVSFSGSGAAEDKQLFAKPCQGL